MCVPPSSLGRFRLTALGAAPGDDAPDHDFVCVAFK